MVRAAVAIPQGNIAMAAASSCGPAGRVAGSVALAGPQGKKITLGTYNVGAASDTAYASTRNRPVFEAKLAKEMQVLTKSCDVICLQEVNAAWAVKIATTMLPEGQ